MSGRLLAFPYHGLIVEQVPLVEEGEWIYAQIEPAFTRWLPWPGRMARWWFEVHTEGLPDEHGVTGVTMGYIKGGSGGAFTLAKCVKLAQIAVSTFAEDAFPDEGLRVIE